MLKMHGLSKLLIVSLMVVGLLAVWSSFTPTIADGFQIGGNVVGDGCPCRGTSTIYCPDDGYGGVCPDAIFFYTYSTVGSLNGTCYDGTVTGHPCHSDADVPSGCGGDYRRQQECNI